MSIDLEEAFAAIKPMSRSPWYLRRGCCEVHVGGKTNGNLSSCIGSAVGFEEGFRWFFFPFLVSLSMPGLHGV